MRDRIMGDNRRGYKVEPLKFVKLKKRIFDLLFVVLITFLMCSCVSRGRRADVGIDTEALEEVGEAFEDEREFEDFSEGDIEEEADADEEDFEDDFDDEDSELAEDEGEAETRDDETKVVSEFDEEEPEGKDLSDESLDLDEDFDQDEDFEDFEDEGEEKVASSDEEDDFIDEEDEALSGTEDKIAQAESDEESLEDKSVGVGGDSALSDSTEDEVTGELESLEDDQQDGDLGEETEVALDSSKEAAEEEKKVVKKVEKSRRSKKFKTILTSSTLDDFLFSRNIKYFGKKISIEIKDGDIRDVIKFITLEQGLNVVLSQEVQGRVTLKLQKVPWDQALIVLMRMQKLGYVRYGNVMQISLKSSIDSELAKIKGRIREERALLRSKKESEIEEMLEQRRFEEESKALVQQEEIEQEEEEMFGELEEILKLKIISLNFSKASDLEEKVKDFLTPGKGTVTSVERTNSLIVKDTDEVIDRISSLVNALDIPPYQVLIKGKFIEVSDSFMKEMGLNFKAGDPDSLFDPSPADPIQIEGGFNIRPSSEETVGVFSSFIKFGVFRYIGNLDATLNLAETEEKVDVLSSPRIVTMNNEEAIIRQKGENLYKTSTREGNTIEEKIDRASIVLELRVKPQISSNRSILMDIKIKREFPGSPLGKTNATPVNTRNAQTKLLVRDGDTAVVGGIFQSDVVASEGGIPILRNIPILGWLFKSRKRAMRRNQLLILLTPNILDTTTGDMRGQETSQVIEDNNRAKEII